MSKYKASIFNYLFNSINMVMMIINGIIMVPVYFIYMPVSVYGAWLASGNLVAMIGLVEAGFSSVITQKMSKAISEGDDKTYRTLAGANILSAIIIASLIFLIGLGFAPFLSDIINVDKGYAHPVTVAYVIALLSAAIAIFVSLFGAFPQVWQDTKSVGIINTITNVCSICALVTGLLCGLGVVALALGYITRSVLNLIIQGTWIYKNWDRHMNGKAIFQMRSVGKLAKDCFYPFLSKMSGVFMGNSQSFIIATFMNPALAAIYDITSKIATCLYGFAGMTNGSFFALFSLTFAKKDKQESNKVAKQITMFFALSVSTILLYSICFTKPIIFYWVGLDKFGGMALLVMIVVSLYINQFKGFFNNILYTGGYINKSSIFDIFCLFSYIALLLATIKFLQQYSLPIAMLITNLLFAWLYVRLLKSKLLLDIKALGKVMAKALAGIVIPLVLYLIYPTIYSKFYLLIIYGIIFTIIYFGSVAFTNREILSYLKLRLKL
ncbi:MAG: oligosaccharide flippase family protein [Muribaculaceae bacterium]|jgi:O-antigen/teichoic acid export membrane protein|nr:oligosaccharide flippase family protein [Muribaculaceae bacterium]